jgi:NADH-quinone oxidoreductase subunit E
MSTVEANAPLSAAERDAILGFVQHYPTDRAACIDALLHVQKPRRYVTDAVLAEVAGLLGMSVAALDEVATFYNLIFRRPVGETVILLCDSITCWMLGRAAVADAMRTRLGISQGQTTADGRFTLLPIVCLGHCDHAPAMLLGNVLHGDVTAPRLDEILEIHVAAGA